MCKPLTPKNSFAHARTNGAPIMNSVNPDRVRPEESKPNFSTFFSHEYPLVLLGKNDADKGRILPVDGRGSCRSDLKYAERQL